MEEPENEGTIWYITESGEVPVFVMGIEGMIVTSV